MCTLVARRVSCCVIVARDLPMEVQIRRKHVLLNMRQITNVPSCLALRHVPVLKLSILRREVTLAQLLEPLYRSIDFFLTTVLTDPSLFLLNSPELRLLMTTTEMLK